MINSDLKIKIKNSLKWSFLGEILGKLITPISYLILAKILPPKDFGILTSGMVIISFSQIFWDAGMTKALIQRQTQVEESANCVFWINSILGLFISIILFCGSNKYYQYNYKDSEIVFVIQILSISNIFSSLSSVQTAYLQKKFEYKKLFIVKLLTVALPSLISIPLAKIGYGYKSLVFGILIGQIGQFIILWIISEWKPKFSFDIKIAKSLLYFSKWVIMGALLSWFYTWIDTLIIMQNFNTDKIGLYNFSNTIVNTIFGFIFLPITPILYNILSILNSKTNINEILYFISKIYMYVSIVISSLVFMIMFNFEDIIFNEEWKGIGLITGIIAISKISYWTIAGFYEGFRAKGMPNVETNIMLVSSPIYLITFYMLSNISFVSIVYGKLILPMSIGFFINMYFIKKHLNIQFYEYLNKIKIGLYTIIILFCLNTISYLILKNFKIELLTVWSVNLLLIISIVYKKEKESIDKIKKIINEKKNI